MGQNNTYPTPSGLHPETENILLKLGIDPIKARAFTEGASDTVNHPTPPTPGNLLTTGLDMIKGPEGWVGELAKRTGSWIAGHSLDKLLHPDPQPTPGNDFGDANGPQPVTGGASPSASATGASPSSASGASVASASGVARPTALAATGDSGSSGADTPSPGGNDGLDAGGTQTAALSAAAPATFTDQDEAELTPDAASWNALFNGAAPDLYSA